MSSERWQPRVAASLALVAGPTLDSCHTCRMLLPIRASSVHLSPDDAQILDDEFFMSRPLAHFSARIASLLEANRSSRPAAVENEPEFFAALGSN